DGVVQRVDDLQDAVRNADRGGLVGDEDALGDLAGRAGTAAAAAAGRAAAGEPERQQKHGGQRRAPISARAWLLRLECCAQWIHDYSKAGFTPGRTQGEARLARCRRRATVVFPRSRRKERGANAGAQRKFGCLEKS